MDERFEGLPGAELVLRGLEDLARGVESDEALLVAIGAPRLRFNGVPVPVDVPDTPELRLYERLGRAHGLDAHAHYNALIRRLVSFERSLESRRSLGG